VIHSHRKNLSVNAFANSGFALKSFINFSKSIEELSSTDCYLEKSEFFERVLEFSLRLIVSVFTFLFEILFVSFVL